MTVRNLDEIRAKDQKLYETLTDIIGQHKNTSEQGNLNPSGQPEPPPAISSLNVTGKNGFFHGAIQDQNPIYRGVSYFVEHADNPNFTDPQIIHLGPSRNFTIQLGNTTRYWRAYSSYSSSGPGAPAYHGNAASPQPVAGGGNIGPPEFLASQGSGTGAPGEGLSGPGPIPFRSPDGKPPIRGTVALASGSGANDLAISQSSVGLPVPILAAAGGDGGGGGGVTNVTATLPITSTGGATPNIAINAATSSTTGAVKPDNSTITISSGILSAAGATIVGIVGCRVVATGIAAIIQIPWNFTVTGWSIIADVAGSVSVDIDFHSGSAPPSAPSIPNTSTDKISASAPVAISSAQSAAGGASAISTWTTALTQWGSVQFNVTVFSTCTWAQINIYGTRS